MNPNQSAIFAILVASIAAAIGGTGTLNLATPVFADGDDHEGKKCKNNEDNNCNDKHKTQKIKTKNECEIENTNKDHSKENTNTNDLECVIFSDNTSDSVFLEIFDEQNGNSLEEEEQPVQ